MKKQKIIKKLVSFTLVLIMIFALVPTIPVSAYGEADATIVAAGWLHSLAIKEDGSLWAWGNNEWGQLGNGVKYGTNAWESRNPVPVKIMDNVISVAAGNYHSLAIKEDGSLWAWGANWSGQLGNGTNTDSLIPVKIMDNVVRVFAGAIHTMVIKSDGSLWGWGGNTYGQFGGDMTKSEPLPIKIMDNVDSVTTGAHTLVIKTDGSLWAWGNNWAGQLGDGTTEYKDKPVKIMDNVTSAAVGDHHSLAVKTDGSLWSWGWNSDGQLGDGTKTIYGTMGNLIENKDKHKPVKIMDNVTSVAARHGYSIAVKTDGSLWAWGWIFGRFDDGTHEDKTKPVKFMDNVTAISAGEYHNLIVKNDGSLWGCGDNRSGQIGDKILEYYTTTLVQITDGLKKTIMYGDLDGDWAITSADLVILARHIAEINTITAPDLLKAADVNVDGKINIADLIRLSQLLL